MSLFQFGFSSSSSSSSVPHVETPDYFPQEEESGLGRDEYEVVAAGVSDLAEPARKKPRGEYTKYTEEDRAKIGRYASESGNERARKHFLSKFPHLTESTVRYFKKLYIKRLQEEKLKENPELITKISIKQRGRPPIMLDLDAKLIKFLSILRSKGGVVNIHVVRATAQALIQSNPSFFEKLGRFSMPRSWVQSIYKRMGYTRRIGTTSRPPVPQGMYDECRQEYLGDINRIIKLYSIPPELVLNSDQTPSSYVSVGKQTMAVHGASSVPIKGLTDKRNITLTFVISLSGEFLPMQIIYGGKTKASLPRGFAFPKGFSLSQNPKHWSNEAETHKLIDEIINPHIVKKPKELGLTSTQMALVIWDVFRGQMTDSVKEKLASLSIELVSVPANMTHFFQPLDLTVNGAAKKFAKKEFVTYYSAEVRRQLGCGKDMEDIEVDLRLTVIKPLHAQWLVNMYNYFTTPNGKEIVLKGWRKSGVTGVLNGTVTLPPEDPFETIYKEQ